MKRYTIGVDLGGTKIAAGLVDENHRILDQVSCPTNLPRPEEEIEAELAQLCYRLARANELSLETDIAWVGIGTPGSVDPSTGIVEFNANFGYRNWHLQEKLEALLPCKVYLENDANAAAYGEYIAGAAKGAHSAVVLTLGTGIGSGIIIDGKIFSGFNAAGAEIGHTVIEKGGRYCMCGRRGCWEKYASARALTVDTRAAMEPRKDNMMWDLVHGDLDRVNAKTAFDGMRAGDPLATELIENFVSYVACGVTNVINIFQPEIICIGGGVSREGETLLGPVRAYVDKEEYARAGAKRTRIVSAKLHNDAGIVGAAQLGLQYLAEANV
jgi:glucokinase